MTEIRKEINEIDTKEKTIEKKSTKLRASFFFLKINEIKKKNFS